MFGPLHVLVDDRDGSHSGMVPRHRKADGPRPSHQTNFGMAQRSTEELESGLDEVRRSPKDGGRLELIVARPSAGERAVLDIAHLDEVEGLMGDNWRTRGSRSHPEGLAHTDRQITLMNARAAQFLAGSRDRWALAGDQLYVDLDVSADNLPAGTRLAIGDAILEVTAAPHRGCAKFTHRFGEWATAFVNSPDGSALRLRGINASVVQSGRIATGDTIHQR